MDWWNPFSAQSAEIVTRLKPEECVERLKPLLLPWHKRIVVSGPGFVTSLAERDGLAGVASREGFRVRLAVPEVMGRAGFNSFQTEASGKFNPSSDRTHIPIRFGLMRSVALSYWPIVGVVGIICVVAGAWMGFIFGVAFSILLSIIMFVFALAFSIGLLWWGRRLARGEAATLTRLLCAALDATEAAAPADTVATERSALRAG